MRRKAVIVAAMKSVILIAILSCAAAAQDAAQRLDDYLNPLVKSGRFSGAVLIARGGKVVASKGYGMANYELDVANTPQTKFRLGSLTKQFTAAAIMQLQEKGLLSVNDPVTKYFPDYKNAEGVTIRHLLSHTGGIPNFTNFPDYPKTMASSATLESLMGRFKDRPLDFPPGEKWSYSNSGYIMLGAIIEKVSGKSYEAYLKENIFDPLGMRNTGYDHNRALLKNRASGYQVGPSGLENAAYIDMTIPHAAGALYSTLEDLYIWDRALYTEKILKKASLEQMFTPVKSNYGYGWVIQDVNGKKRISHSGGINGFTTHISRFVDDDGVLIVLVNLLGAPNILQTITTIALGETPQAAQARTAIKLDPKVYDAFVGRYELTPEFAITVTREGDQLMGQATGQPKFELFPESETKFFLKVVDAQITFLKNEKGEVTGLILHQNGQNMPAKRVK